MAVAAGASAGAALWQPAGAVTPDTSYTAVTPCVVFDSRATQGATGGFLGPINGNQAVTYLTTGVFPAGQGGGASTCGIPAGAASVEINVVAVNAINEGNLKVSDGSPVTSGGIVNYNYLTPKLITSNTAIVPLDVTGHLVVTPNCGAGCTVDSTDIRWVMLGYFTDSLATRLAAVEAKLQDVTRIPAGVGGQPTVRFSGVNVQIVDGTGTTGCNDATPGGFESACNGRGNLIVGYAENSQAFPRTGSHNVVGGQDNGWTSYGGAVLGYQNQITNDVATILGGNLSEATGSNSAILGGSDNTASGGSSTVTGGQTNTASGNGSSVTGGLSNVASGGTSTVSGGSFNSASSTGSAVTGGFSGVANAAHATVTGGQFNLASGITSTVAGGVGNGASGDASAVTGGTQNTASGIGSSVSGGRLNSASGDTGSVSRGAGRTALNADDWVAGALFQNF